MQQNSIMIGSVYRVKMNFDEFWIKYLAHFTDKALKERDCVSCRTALEICAPMVANIGVKDPFSGNTSFKLVSIFDIKGAGKYQPLADNLAKFVKSKQIENIYLHLLDDRHRMTKVRQADSNHLRFELHPKLIATNLDGCMILADAFLKKNFVVDTLEYFDEKHVKTVLNLVEKGAIDLNGESLTHFQNFVNALHCYRSQRADYQRNNVAWHTAANDSIPEVRNSNLGGILAALQLGDSVQNAIDTYKNFNSLPLCVNQSIAC